LINQYWYEYTIVTRITTTSITSFVIGKGMPIASGMSSIEANEKSAFELDLKSKSHTTSFKLY
jgi:hypothetical protein